MIAILFILLVSTALCAGIVIVVCLRAYIAEYHKRALLKAHNAQLLADYMAQIEITRQVTAERDEARTDLATVQTWRIHEQHQAEKVTRELFEMKAVQLGPMGLPRVIQFLYPN